MDVTDLSENFFGIHLTTYHDHGPLKAFPYGFVISAVSIFFFRTTVRLPFETKEPNLLRFSFAVVLAFLAYSNKPYEVVFTIEISSYLVSFLIFSEHVSSFLSNLAKTKLHGYLLRFFFLGLSATFCQILCHLAASGYMFKLLNGFTPPIITHLIMKAFPIEEVKASYEILDDFILEDGLLKAQVARLMFITFHIQVGIGYLGINFLKQEQHRRNELVRMDIETNSHNLKGESELHRMEKMDTNIKRSVKFQRTAAPFIFFTAIPYMIQVIGYGNLNAFAFICMKDDVHRSIRLHNLFDHDNHLVALSEHSAKAPSDFAGYMDTVVSTTYDLFNRKLFSLPKVLLLPVVISKQPKMIAKIFPIIFMSDWVKGRAISFMTNRIEELEKDVQELTAKRSQVEAYDLKNSEILLRSGPGATDFTKQRWLDLTVKIQMKLAVSTLTSRTKGFFSFIQRNFVFSVLVDCALASLISVGRLVAADVFVYSRAIEDTVDMALMRSRSEAELARMMTQIANLKELSSVWRNAKERNLLSCSLGRSDVGHTSNAMVILKNVMYTRGTARVHIHDIQLSSGIYALTGGNGSGKSTLFRLIMSCSTNNRPIDIPRSVSVSTLPGLVDEDYLHGQCTNDTEAKLTESSDSTSDTGHCLQSMIVLPSPNVVEISQSFYWPLYSKPRDWILHEASKETLTKEEMNEQTRRVAELLVSLDFAQVSSKEVGHETKKGNVSTLAYTESENIVLNAPIGDAIARVIEELEDEKEDWFKDLSGGQRSKVELVRKVFLMEECPRVLLIDETMAPLDPRSKSLVMKRLKSFCTDSVLIVIYHADVGKEEEKGSGGAECVPSSDFFTGNIHVEGNVLKLRTIC